MRRIKSSLGFVFSFALAACGGGSSGLSPYEAQQEAKEHAVATLCECYAAQEFATEAACIAQYSEGEPTAAEVDCVVAAYAAHEEDALPSTECQRETFETVHDCLHDVNACDADAIDACVETVPASIEACPALPQALRDALDACDAP